MIDPPNPDNSKLGLLINVICENDDVLSRDFVKKARACLP